jgi:hypothetical protein
VNRSVRYFEVCIILNCSWLVLQGRDGTLCSYASTPYGTRRQQIPSTENSVATNRPLYASSRWKSVALQPMSAHQQCMANQATVDSAFACRGLRVSQATKARHPTLPDHRFCSVRKSLGCSFREEREIAKLTTVIRAQGKTDQRRCAERPAEETKD